MILNNLRDGLPFPYTEQDALDYINGVLSADENDSFVYAVTIDDQAIGSIGAFRQSNIHRQTAELSYYLSEEYWEQESEQHPWMGLERYHIAQKMLDEASEVFDVSDCFEILKAVSPEVCPTVVSMVFDVTEMTLY